MFRRTTLVSASAFVGLLAVAVSTWSPALPGAVARALPSASTDKRKPIEQVPVTLSTPGSYYVSTQLQGVSGKSGITISCDDVTIDLNGFTLAGAPGSLDGIVVSGSFKNVAVYGGTVDAWGGNGINADTASGAGFHDLKVTRNGLFGLRSGTRSTVRDCQVAENGGGAPGNDGGIYARDESVLESCTLRANTTDGIVATSFCVLKRCISSSHLASNGTGIRLAGTSNLVEECRTQNNTRGYATEHRATDPASTNDRNVVIANMSTHDTRPFLDVVVPPNTMGTIYKYESGGYIDSNSNRDLASSKINLIY